ncbi:MAG: bifunctional 5,10-methylenetetrahydrofolate dehydrogenase/5,10-methenyltetrahydrofolate cyclohydrolase [Phycisphaeraceae bacterium]|nr:bifunctional 5,10-methylenetetrahydrofolate dehydrogenase/5,10-methenyltetrahydrofolate cyclohydrolase [Phycisphaeraceae bacterium]
MSSASIIDGRALAEQYRRDIAARAATIKSRGGIVRLDALLADAGDNAARVYAENQGKTCADLGIEYRLHHFRPDANYDEVAGRVLLLNTKDEVPAIMVHLPLPPGVEPYRIQRLIAPEKDIEGVNPANIGNVVYGQSSLVPCTALAVLKMVQSTGVDIRGKRAVVVGAGDVVGKPIAVLLMRQDATVISCNKWTWGLDELARSADILVAAAGVPGLITPAMVKPGAIVIDVGVNRVQGQDGKMKTVGDVDFEGVRKIAGFISPVPGGVGPVTVAMLLLNVVEAAERNAGFTR